MDGLLCEVQVVLAFAAKVFTTDIGKKKKKKTECHMHVRKLGGINVNKHQQQTRNT